MLSVVIPAYNEQEMVPAATQSPLACCRPAKIAASLPKLREKCTPRTFCPASDAALICAQVASFEPSSMKQMRLMGPIVPAARRAVNFSRSWSENPAFPRLVAERRRRG